MRYTNSGSGDRLPLEVPSEPVLESRVWGSPDREAGTGTMWVPRVRVVLGQVRGRSTVTVPG